MGSSNVSEDGTSERVRFDNFVYYSMDEAIEMVKFKKKTICILTFRFDTMNVRVLFVFVGWQ